MRIERIQDPEAWPRLRAIRLRALADAPDAFARTLAEEEAMEAEAWRARMRPDVGQLLAVDEAGRDVGMAVGAPYRGLDDAVGLFGMWVAPEARGAGIGDALVEAVVAWARERGAARVVLDVADDNARAVAFYARLGFAPTGVRATLPPPREHITEHQRARPCENGPRDRRHSPAGA